MSFDPDCVETVTVDSYGTLVNPSSIQRTLGNYVDNPELVAAQWFSRGLLNKLVSNAIDAYQPFEVLSRDSLEYALQQNGIHLGEAEKDEILASYDELDIYDGVDRGIRDIVNLGYDVYVVSNGSPRMLDKLVSRTNIDDVVSGTVSAHEVKTYKPDPKIYRHAAARTGTPIDEVVHVSGPYFDVLGAMHAGMQGCWINYGDSPRDTFAGGPDIEVSSFPEFADLLSNR